MPAISRVAHDHRRRMLEHQERVEATATARLQPSDPQLKIPLIGEVRRPVEPALPISKRPKAKRRIQPKLTS